MSELDDRALESLLREHLSGELDGQLGRCAAAFARHAGQAPPMRLADAPAGPGPAAPRTGGRLNAWFIGLAGAALAASVAGLWTAPAGFRGGPPVVPVRTAPPADPGRPDLAVAGAGGPKQTEQANPGREPTLRWVQSRTWDEGTVVLDDGDDADHPVPARKIRQQQVEHTRWYDPDHRARVEMTVPRENVKFVGMDTY